MGNLQKKIKNMLSIDKFLQEPCHKKFICSHTISAPGVHIWHMNYKYDVFKVSREDFGHFFEISEIFSKIRVNPPPHDFLKGGL